MLSGGSPKYPENKKSSSMYSVPVSDLCMCLVSLFNVLPFACTSLVSYINSRSSNILNKSIPYDLGCPFPDFSRKIASGKVPVLENFAPCWWLLLTLDAVVDLWLLTTGMDSTIEDSSRVHYCYCLGCFVLRSYLQPVPKDPD